MSVAETERSISLLALRTARREIILPGNERGAPWKLIPEVRHVDHALKKWVCMQTIARKLDQPLEPEDAQHLRAAEGYLALSAPADLICF